jgi:hypothetical protein
MIVVIRDPNDCASAYRTDLGLQKPFPQACLMKNMLAIRNSHELSLLKLEFFKAYRAVKIFGVLIESNRFQMPHVSISDFLGIIRVLIFKPLSASAKSSIAKNSRINEKAKEDYQKCYEEPSNENGYPQQHQRLVIILSGQFEAICSIHSTTCIVLHCNVIRGGLLIVKVYLVIIDPDEPLQA